LSKEKFKLEACSDDKAEGLSVRGRTYEKDGTSKRSSRSKSKGRKSSKFYKYCRKQRYLVDECYKLKNKKEKDEENNQSAEASIVDSRSDGDVLLITTMDNKGATKWVLDSSYIYHMYPQMDWLSTYKPLDSSVVLIGNDA